MVGRSSGPVQHGDNSDTVDGNATRGRTARPRPIGPLLPGSRGDTVNGMNTPEVKETARQVGGSAPLAWGARLGYAVSGLLHLLIGWIALKIAWGLGGGTADQSGALATVAGSSGGLILLWVAVAGFVLLALWQVLEVVTGAHGAKAADRLKSGGKAIAYAALAVSAFTFARGGGTSSRAQTRDATAGIMAQPGGRVLVGLLGLGVLAVGAYHVYKGWTGKFLQDLAGRPGAWVVGAGRVGYVAKGVALGIVGVLFVVAGLHRSTKDATGLDGALRALRAQPFGQYLLTLVALGLVAFGVHTLARARYTKV